MLTFTIVPQETTPEDHTRPDAGSIALSEAPNVVYPEHMTEQAHTNPAGGGGDLPREPKPGVSDEVLEFAARLFDMAREGDTVQLAGYIDAGVSPELTNERGDAFLMLAAYNGNLETVQMLLDRGVDVNKLNDRGQTPLAGRCSRVTEKSSRRCSRRVRARIRDSPPPSRRRRCSRRKRSSSSSAADSRNRRSPERQSAAAVAPRSKRGAVR